MDEEHLSPHKNKNLLTYGAIAAGGVVILLVMMKKGAAGSATTDTSGGGANTTQPVIISGGGGSTGADPTTTAALTQLAANQQTLSDGLAQGFAGLANNEATANTSLAQGITAGFASVASLFANQAQAAAPVMTPGPVTTSSPTTPAAAVHTIFGATVDVQSAESVFGTGSGYNYVDTSNMTNAQTRSALQAAGSTALIVGGTGAGGGVDATEAQGLGITRVAGQDRTATLAAIRNVNF